MPRPAFILAFLLALCFTLATWLEPHSRQVVQDGNSGGLLKALLGDGRRMFANQFNMKADAYFHSGYYPTFFEQAQTAAVRTNHLKEEMHEKHDGHEEEHETEFLAAPDDWIARFGRHFYPSTHSHLDKPGEAKEILPWLKLSAKLNPEQIDTYTMGAYWMRKSLGKPSEAEQFLRQGLQANPNNYELLYELGTLYYEDRHELVRARNLYELALKHWHLEDTADKKPDEAVCDRILARLAQLEDEQGNIGKALSYLQEELKYSPVPDVIRNHMEELKKKPGASRGK